MSDFELDSAVLLLIAALLLKNKRKKNRTKRWWSRNFLLKRDSHGPYSTFFEDLRSQDSLKQYLRMNSEDFNYLLEKIRHKIERQHYVRAPISAEDKLLATLRFIATGDDYSSIMFHHRISKTAISKFIPEVCDALVDVLKNEMPVFNSFSEKNRNTIECINVKRFILPHCVNYTIYQLSMTSYKSYSKSSDESSFSSPKHAVDAFDASKLFKLDV